MSQISPARHAAFDILIAMERSGHSDRLLRSPRLEAFCEADRRLATALVLGVLRWQIGLDTRFRALLKRSGARLAPEVLTALRLGAFQLLRMNRIPAHAAIHDSVELTKQSGHRFASAMVNAVLRKLSTSMPELVDVREGYPEWMVERWTAFYGEKAASEVCRYGQEQPILTARVQGNEDQSELASKGVRLEPADFLAAARRIVSGDITRTKAFQQDRVRIQDEGSQLIAELVPRGRAILDCCAAPGGKTLILGERNRNADIAACDSSPQRLAELRIRLRSLGDRVECRLADAARLTEKNAFDVALADVPCSGTGTLGRNPEIRHRLNMQDLERQSERQQAILHTALRAVRPSGLVLYSTCSLEPEENEQIIEAVLRKSPGTRIVSLDSRVGELCSEGIVTPSGAARLAGCITPRGSLRLMPGDFGTDGFFAVLIKKSDQIVSSGPSFISS